MCRCSLTTAVLQGVGQASARLQPAAGLSPLVPRREMRVLPLLPSFSVPLCYRLSISGQGGLKPNAAYFSHNWDSAFVVGQAILPGVPSGEAFPGGSWGRRRHVPKEPAKSRPQPRLAAPLFLQTDSYRQKYAALTARERFHEFRDRVEFSLATLAALREIIL